MSICLTIHILHILHYTKCSFPPRIYHPWCFNCFTRETVALKPSKNLVLHLSLLSLFLFKPPLSWNLCFIESLLILFLAQLISISRKPFATSIPVLPIVTLLPVLGFRSSGLRGGL